MAFNPIVVKLGTNECADAYPNILSQNDIEGDERDRRPHPVAGYYELFQL